MSFDSPDVREELKAWLVIRYDMGKVEKDELPLEKYAWHVVGEPILDLLDASGEILDRPEYKYDDAPPARVLLADLRRARNGDGTVQALLRAYQSSSRSSSAAVQYGAALVRIGKEKEAGAILNPLLDDSSLSKPMQALLEYAVGRLGGADANKHIEKASRLSPGSEGSDRAMLARAVSSDSTARWAAPDKAASLEADWRRVLGEARSSIKDEELLRRLENLSLEHDKHGKEKELTDAGKKASDDRDGPALLRVAGDALAARLLPEEARRWVLRAIDLGQASWTADALLARACAETERYGEAIASAKRALSRDPPPSERILLETDLRTYEEAWKARQPAAK